MMNIIKPPAPQYRGCQPPTQASGGLFAQLLCYLFGGGTPTYQGNGQPAPRGCGPGLLAGTPAYKAPEPVPSDVDELSPLDPSDDDLGDKDELSAKNGSANPSQTIDTMGSITIVVG